MLKISMEQKELFPWNWIGRTIVLLMIVLFTCACGNFNAEPTSTFTSIPPTESATATVTFTNTPMPSITPFPTNTSTPTLTPTATFTPTPALFVLEGTPLPELARPISVLNAQYVSGLAQWKVPAVTDLAFSPDGLILAISDNEKIYLFNAYTRKLIRTLHPDKTGIVDIEFSPDGLWLVSGSRQGSEVTGYRSALELWYGSDYTPLGLLYGSLQGLSSMTFSPSGERLFVANASPVYHESFIDFWDTDGWVQTGLLETGTVLGIGVSVDGSLLASTPDRYAIRVWDLEDSIWLYTIYTSFTGAVNKITFSPTQLNLAAGQYDGGIRIWEMESGELIQAMDSDGVIESLAYTPDGRLLASGNSFENGHIRLWDVQTGEQLRELVGHENGVTSMAFSPDGYLLVSGSYDGVVHVWGIRP